MHLSWKEVYYKNPELWKAAFAGRPVPRGYSNRSPEVLQALGEDENAYVIPGDAARVRERSGSELYPPMGFHSEGCCCEPQERPQWDHLEEG